jgi:hypothetical protein
MEYISAKEFLRQSKEVQKVFIDWYKNQKEWQTDLFDYIGNCDAYKAKFPTVGNNIDFRVLKHGEETLIYSQKDAYVNLLRIRQNLKFKE